MALHKSLNLSVIQICNMRELEYIVSGIPPSYNKNHVHQH